MTRVSVAIAALLIAPSAFAWPFEVLPEARLKNEVHGIAVVPDRDGTALLALGESSSWVVEPASGEIVRALSAGGVDATALDLDGDGARELVLCGPAGLVGNRWESDSYSAVPETLSERPCAALTTLDHVDGVRLVAAGADGAVHTYQPGQGGLTEIEAVHLAARGDTTDSPLSGEPLLASRRGYLAISMKGRQSVLEHGPTGDSSLATGGPVGGLAPGPRGWTWSLPDRDMVADVTHRVIPVAPRPGALAMGHFDDDGERDLVVLHPTEQLVGIIPANMRGEATHPVPDGIDHLSTGDVDMDGCDDVILGSSSYGTVGVWRSTACMGVPLTIRRDGDAAIRDELEGRATLRGASEEREPLVREPPPAVVQSPATRPPDAPSQATYERPPALPPPPTVFGVEAPKFTGDGPLIDHERLDRQSYVILGTGWVIGGTLGPTRIQIPFFPSLSVEFETGTRRARWFVGGDSAGLFFWAADDGSGGIHLANLSTGATFGSPRLRTGPFVTAGLYNVGAGLRTVITPWQESRTEFRGLEARLTWFAPRTGQVSLMYVWSEPLRAPGERDLSRLRERAERRARDPKALRPRGPFACSRINTMAGIALGASSTLPSWEFVGSNVPLAISGSPMLSVACETGDKGGLLISAETAPFFNFITKDDARLHHMGSHTFGPMVGGEHFRMGPIGMLGFWTSGAGVRASFDIAKGREGLHHRLDLRALGLYPSAPSGQVMLMYGISYDPRG